MGFVSFGSLEALSGEGRTLSRVSTLHNIDGRIADLRVIKDDLEIEFLRQACEVTAQGLNDVFRAVKAGMQEKDLSDLLESGFQVRRLPRILLPSGGLGAQRHQCPFRCRRASAGRWGCDRLRRGRLVERLHCGHQPHYPGEWDRSPRNSGRSTRLF